MTVTVVAWDEDNRERSFGDKPWSGVVSVRHALELIPDLRTTILYCQSPLPFPLGDRVHRGIDGSPDLHLHSSLKASVITLFIDWCLLSGHPTDLVDVVDPAVKEYVTFGHSHCDCECI